MANIGLLKAAGVVAAVALTVGSANAATYSYVGSWTVDEGPSWTTTPPSYSGQEAAALLFGGTPGDYVISTVSDSVADIDFQSWVSVWFASSFPECPGLPCGSKVAQDFKVSTSGFYQNPGDTSAYVSDWALGSEFRNYAFQVSAVPLPAGGWLLLAGIGGLAAFRRSKKEL